MRSIVIIHDRREWSFRSIKRQRHRRWWLVVLLFWYVSIIVVIQQYLITEIYTQIQTCAWDLSVECSTQSILHEFTFAVFLSFQVSHDIVIVNIENAASKIRLSLSVMNLNGMQSTINFKWLSQHLRFHYLTLTE